MENQEHQPRLIFRRERGGSGGGSAMEERAKSAARQVISRALHSKRGREPFRRSGINSPQNRQTVFTRAAVRRARNYSPHWQRVVVKTRLVKGGGGKGRAHLNYITREGGASDGGRGTLFGSQNITDSDFVTNLDTDPHHWRMIVSPENELDDFQKFSQNLVSTIERDLQTNVEWRAVVHHDTAHPHVHLVMRGRDGPLYIPNDYLTAGIRYRAGDELTQQLGYRSELDIQRSQEREIGRAQVIGLDNQLADLEQDAVIRRDSLAHDTQLERRADKIIEFGLATENNSGQITFETEWRNKLRQYAAVAQARERAGHFKEVNTQEVIDLDKEQHLRRRIIGEVIGRGLADELHDKPFVIVDGADGRLYHKTFTNTRLAAGLTRGAIAQISPGRRATDERPAGLAFVKTISPHGLTGAIREEGHNWLDDHGKARTQSATQTLFQKRLDAALIDRDKFRRPGQENVRTQELKQEAGLTFKPTDSLEHVRTKLTEAGYENITQTLPHAAPGTETTGTVVGHRNTDTLLLVNRETQQYWALSGVKDAESLFGKTITARLEQPETSMERARFTLAYGRDRVTEEMERERQRQLERERARMFDQGRERDWDRERDWGRERSMEHDLGWER